MDKCRGPWFLRWFKRGHDDQQQVAACEAAFMEKCVATAASECRAHAGHFCEAAFPMVQCGDGAAGLRGALQFNDDEEWRR
eukprot:CAMPEP_0202894776 /NCGR_PEP_ID=MMETSP1392-20130828/4098_1 /ASSEMBLY_ACC=CAM_ASM_000868 /TAXON_ID=225041 /ORGANISM="Chlamydomonas chlamydogama, Strain SAG 11-48b" /LENGTH=80 /DNA_ID=CAMNT_0049579565 /DNA_START=217 /DNA_END=459 /DNA_ORIENTATION=-